MTTKNKYAHRSKISKKKKRETIKLFSFNLDASQITKISGSNRNSINRYLTEILIRISEYCQLQSPCSGEVEVDESYFSARRVKRKRGRELQGKTIVFGIFKRNGNVYTEICPELSKSYVTSGNPRSGKTFNSTIHGDGWRGYKGLVDLGYKKNFRVYHGQNEFVHDKSHINGIESF